MSRPILAVALAAAVVVGAAVVPTVAAVASTVDRADDTGVIELTVDVPGRTTIPDATPPAPSPPTPSAPAMPTRTPPEPARPAAPPSSTSTPRPDSTVLPPRNANSDDALAVTGAGPWLLGAAAALALVAVGAAVRRGAGRR